MEKIIKRIHEILTDHKNRIIRLEKVPVPTYTAGAVLVGGANGLPTVDADLEFTVATKTLRTGRLELGIGDNGSGDNTYIAIVRSADTGGTVSIDAFRSGIGGTTLKLNTVFGGPVEIAVQSWQTPTLLNSWVDFGGGYNDTKYFKDPFGVVHIKGLIKSGTIGLPAFTLPSGYRPLSTEIYGVVSNSAFAELRIAASGSVIPISGNNAWFSLDGITFRAA